jgi:hypothetical protein
LSSFALLSRDRPSDTSEAPSNHHLHEERFSIGATHRKVQRESQRSRLSRSFTNVRPRYATDEFIILRGNNPDAIADVNKGNPKRTLIDERLSARLLVNEKILELIMTVITALEHSNPEKVRHLISIADDPSSLKRIFRKQHIQDFVMTLKDHSLVNRLCWSR